MTPLCELAKKYGTDKFIPHNYTPVYYRMLCDRTEKVRKVLEVGIAEGAKSLRMWEEFFPNAEIIGVDVDNRWMVNQGRIRSIKANQEDNAAMAQIGRKHGKFDLIVEDGDHKPIKQIAAMKALLPFLADDGLYFMEDIWTDMASMLSAVPKGYEWCVVYQSNKVVPNGQINHMMCVRRTRFDA